jgi:hypothetical protein
MSITCTLINQHKSSQIKGTNKMLNQAMQINSRILIISVSGAKPFSALTILTILISEDSHLIRITNFDFG